MAYYKTNINTIKTRLSKRSKQAQEKKKKGSFQGVQGSNRREGNKEQELGGLMHF